MRKSRLDTATGTLVSLALAKAGKTQIDLATESELSNAMISFYLTGQRHAAAEWYDLVATFTGMSDDDRRRLHRAAAIEAGYDIGLNELDLSKP